MLKSCLNFFQQYAENLFLCTFRMLTLKNMPTKQANFLSELNNDKIIKLHSTIDTNINSLNLLKKQIDKFEEEIINLRRLEQKMHNE